MPNSNNLNPDFLGRTTALGFDATHGKGVSSTAVVLTGRTAVDIFGATNGFSGTITALTFQTLSGSGTVTVTNRSDTVATITEAAAGLFAGPAAAIAFTGITLTGTTQVVSNDTLDVGTLIVWYKVAA